MLGFGAISEAPIAALAENSISTSLLETIAAAAALVAGVTFNAALTETVAAGDGFAGATTIAASLAQGATAGTGFAAGTTIPATIMEALVAAQALTSTIGAGNGWDYVDPPAPEAWTTIAVPEPDWTEITRDPDYWTILY